MCYHRRPTRIGVIQEERKGDEFYFLGTDLAPVKVPDIEEQEDKAAAAKVEDMISDLPPLKDIKLSDEEEVQSVADAYNALTANQKKYVTNYDKLVAALEKIESLKEQEEDKKKAAKVEDAIDKLPKVENLSLDDKEAVEDAREAYDNLTNQQKALVKDLAKLEAAENKIKAAKVEKIIDDLPYIEDLTLEHKEERNARAAYEALTEAQSPGE